jgi:phosphate uptake regulator
MYLGCERERPETTRRATCVQAISRYIERIGDHATNAAERLLFILTAEDIRHVSRMRRGDFS